MGSLLSQRSYLLPGALLMVTGVSAAELVGLKQENEKNTIQLQRKSITGRA